MGVCPVWVNIAKSGLRLRGVLRSPDLLCESLPGLAGWHGRILRCDGVCGDGARPVEPVAQGSFELGYVSEDQVEHWAPVAGRRWESIEGDLRIEARHQYGHVQLRVTLRRARADWGNEGWSATGDLTIEPGEQLTEVAQDVRRLSDGSFVVRSSHSPPL